MIARSGRSARASSTACSPSCASAQTSKPERSSSSRRSSRMIVSSSQINTLVIVVSSRRTTKKAPRGPSPSEAPSPSSATYASRRCYGGGKEAPRKGPRPATTPNAHVGRRCRKDRRRRPDVIARRREETMYDDYAQLAELAAVLHVLSTPPVWRRAQPYVGNEE